MNDMSPPLTHYDVLGVGRKASFADIRASYLKLVKIYHPDKAVPHRKAAALMIFQTITAAYATLRNPETRAAYDESLGEGQRAAAVNDNATAVRDSFWKRLFGSLV